MTNPLQAMSANICVLDDEANVVQANVGYEAVVGRARSAIIGHNLSEWVQPSDLAECRRLMDRTATDAPADFMCTYQRPDGTFCVVAGEALRLPQAAGGYIVSCSRLIYASTGAVERCKIEAAEYVASLAAELARSADRVGLASLGGSLRDLTGHATAVLRGLDDGRPAPPPPAPGDSAW